MIRIKFTTVFIIALTCGFIESTNAQSNIIENGSTVFVEDAWSLTNALYVGNATEGNSLIVTNGGTLSSAGSYIGFEASSDHNSVVLTGPISDWNSSRGIYLGVRGSFNTLRILDGAQLSSPQYYSSLGNNYVSGYNLLQIDGVGSQWTTSLIHMSDGYRNTISVSGGGSLTTSSSLVLGARETAHSNKFIAEGAGTTVDVDNDICMGIYWWDWRRGDPFALMGVDNKLAIKNGAACTVGNTIMNWHYSTVEIGENAVLSASDYSMNNTSDLIITCAENASESGRLIISGDVSVSGDLIVTKDPGVTLETGYSVDLIDGVITGMFTHITLPDLPVHLSWDTSMLYSNGIISIYTEDADSDGIADPWEIVHFGSTSNCTAIVDSDGDGQNNYTEYVAGTDPHLNTSCLRLSIHTSEGDCVLSWEPVEYRVYGLELTPNISSTPFATITNGLPSLQSSMTVTNNPSGEGFYRLSVEIN